MKFIVEVNSVTKSYGDVVAVSDVSFRIPQGDIMGFLGPNGSGKTTSIKMLLGLTKPQTGQISVLGANPFTNRRFKFDVGYVPETDCFYRWITAFDFLENYARFQLPREQSRKRAIEILEEIGLRDVANKKILEFSKGMKQRIKLGQALIHKPSFIIADEPFNGLDPIVRKQFFDLMIKYSEDYQTTWFVSSHVLFEVERLAKNIILLYKGRTIAQGSPSRIRAMIQEQPHSIQITSPVTRDLVKLLVDQSEFNDIVSSLEFDNRPTEFKQDLSFTIETKNPVRLYQLLTDLVVDNNIPISEIKPTDEGLEALFKTLTVG